MDEKRTGIWRFDDEKGKFVRDEEASVELEKLKGRDRLNFVKTMVFAENRTPELVERMTENFLTAEFIKIAEIIGGTPENGQVEAYRASEDFAEEKDTLVNMCLTLEPAEWTGFIAFMCMKARDGVHCGLSDAAEDEWRSMDA